MAEASGNREKALAKAIRSAASEQYDLAGYSGLQAAELMSSAFSTPLEVDEMCVWRLSRHDNLSAALVRTFTTRR